MKMNSFAVLTVLLLEYVLFVEIFCGRGEIFQGALVDKTTAWQSASEHTEVPVPPTGIPEGSTTMGPRPGISELYGSGEAVSEEDDPYNGFYKNGLNTGSKHDPPIVQPVYISGVTTTIGGETKAPQFDKADDVLAKDNNDDDGGNDDKNEYSFEGKGESDESDCLDCDGGTVGKKTDSPRTELRLAETGTELPVTLPPPQGNKDVLNTVFKVAGVVGGLCFLVVLMNCIQVIVIVTYFKKRSANKIEIDDQSGAVPKLIVTKNKDTHEEHSIVEVDLKTFHPDESGDSSKAEMPETSVDSNNVRRQEEQPNVTTAAAVSNFQTDNSMKEGDCQNSPTESDPNAKPDQLIPVGSTDVAIHIPLPPPPEVMPVTNYASSEPVNLADIAMTDPLNTIQLDVDEAFGQQKPAISSSLDAAQDEKPSKEEDIPKKEEKNVLSQTGDPTNLAEESVTPPLSHL